MACSTHSLCRCLSANPCIPATQIAPATATMDGLSSKFVLPAKPWSVNVLQLHLGPAPSSAAITLQADVSAGVGSGMDGAAAS